MSKSNGAATTGYRRWGDSSAGAEPAREMPSAFGGGDRNRHRRDDARREEDARRAWDERRAAKAEAERQVKLRDFTNTEQYPALGGGSRSAAAAPKPKAMNFLDMARETAARSALEEAEAVAAAKRRELEASRQVYGGAGSAAGPRLYRHGSYDDGPVDHDFPDEEGYYPPDEYAAALHGDECGDAEADAEAEAEADAEFNSHLAVNRRRGDKSDW